MAYTTLKGYEGEILIGDGPDPASTTFNTIGRVESFTVEINQNLERFSQIGTRKTVIVDGQLGISGSFSRALIDASMISLATGILASGGNLGNADLLPQDINVRARGSNSNASREFEFTLVGVTIDGWSIEMTPEDIVMEDVDYIARSVQFSDQEGLTDDFSYDDAESATGLYG